MILWRHLHWQWIELSNQMLIILILHCFQCPTWCCKLVLSRPWFCHKNQSTTFSTKRIGSLYWSTHYTFWKQTPKPLPFKQLCTPTICKLTREQVTWGETCWCFFPDILGPKWQNRQENQKTSFDPWRGSEEKLDRGHGVKLFRLFWFCFFHGFGAFLVVKKILQMSWWRHSD